MKPIARVAGTLVVCLWGASARAQTQVKPEFMMIIDTSGSMTASTSPPAPANNSCGYTSTRINDAKCAFRRIVDAQGDAIFGLERFSATCRTSDGVWRGIDQTGGPTCTLTATSGQVLVGITDGNANSLVPWVNNTPNPIDCRNTTDPELHAAGNTPLAGSLRQALAYYQNQVAGLPSPMIGDPFAACRPHYVILLTDGDETCGTNADVVAAAQALHTTFVSGVGTFDVKTFVIGFGQTCPYTNLENIAVGGNTDAPGACRSFYASDEQSLSIALSQIIASSLLIEHCNNVDDNCNMVIDEGFDKGAACSVGLGICQRNGTKICGCAAGDATCDPTLGVVGRGPFTTICVDGMGNPLVPGTPGTETCPNNGVDDDCNGVIDDVPGGCPTPTPEACNGIDDDRDSSTDEWIDLFPCQSNMAPFPANCRCLGAGNVVTNCPGSGTLPTNCGCLPACGSNVGQCRTGLQECISGGPICAGATGPTPELCNCLDDNCNGVVDDVPPTSCYSGPPGTSGVGICRPGATQCQCVGGVASTICTGEITPTSEVACNGLDDNCNGVVDEPQGQPCYPAGTPGCVDGGGGSFTCTGTCHTGTFQCQGGNLVCANAGTPTSEICDGLDNNCDGTADNFVCGQAQGICTAQCQQIGGVWQCNTHVGQQTETCNGLDDDCDGIIDNNLGMPFGNPCPPAGATCNLMTGTCCGICTLGTIRCLGGQQVCDGATAPRAETCNNLDDDCNCAVDDNVPGFGGTCGSNVGICRTGTFQCVMGMGQCTGGVGPGTETCNNLDDDCNGVVDDNVPGVGNPCYDAGPPTNCNLTANPPTCNGLCRPGQLVCNGLAGQLQCQGQLGPQPEICNGLDDDCNGVVDDNFNVGGPCTVMFGTCSSMGRFVCRPDGSGTVCNAPPVSSSPEICDGLDNNCNGIVDEPYGIWPCPSGAPNPAGCICPTGRSCGNTSDLPLCSCPPQCGIAVGECLPGHLDCNNGMQRCIGGTAPTNELCNCRDDNCNGIVDDNPMGEGDSCFTFTGPNGQPLSTNPPSTCRPGHKHCEDMGAVCDFVCLDQIGPQAEICDGLDNDCDGIVDNGAMCPPMFACINGSCQPTCQIMEFPCRSDRRCIDPQTGNECRPPRTNCVCLPNLCATANCDMATQDCIILGGMAMCRDRCPPGHCPPPTTCNPSTGMCVDCHTTGCPSGQVCTGSPGMCVNDPCSTVNCPPGQFCRNGNCIGTCPGGCPPGEICVDGTCQMSRCFGVQCNGGEICNPHTGQCEPDHCTLGCPLGDRCVPATGMCEPDPCPTVRCEACYQCDVDFDGNGTCVPQPGCSPPPSLTATTTGGGGCACEIGGAEHDESPPFWLLFGIVAVVLVRRGRR